MRNFDLLQNFVDDKGLPLHGKIMFTERGSIGESYPALKAVYNSAGNEIANPVFTDNLGKTETQVFIDNGEYSVWLFKYVGGGEMSTDVDSEHWELVDNFDLVDVYSDLAVNLDNTKLRCVDTIEDLRQLNPALVPGTVKVVAVKGYFSAGDKKPVFYKAISSGTDNGGNIIQSRVNTSVYWSLVGDSNAVDVRDFGVFPGKGDSTNVGQIAAAINYANSRGKDVYFSVGDYKLNGGNYYIENKLITDETTFFTGKNGTTTSLLCSEFEGEHENMLLSENTGYISLYAPIVRTSYAGGSCRVYASDTLIVDSDVSLDSTLFGTPKKCIVECESTKAIYFKNCIVEVPGCLLDNVNYTFTNCVLLPENFSDLAQYFRANILNGNKDVNFGGLYCPELTISNSGTLSYTLRNGNFGKLTVKNSAGTNDGYMKLTLRNCNVNELCGDYYWHEISIYNSFIVAGQSRKENKTTADGIYSKTFAAVSSTITTNGSKKYIGFSDEKVEAVYIENSDILCIVNTNKARIENSTIRNTVKIGAIYEDDEVSFNVNGNVFFESGCISLNGNGAGSVSFVCCNNVFNTSQNGFQLSNITDASGYRYENNSGNCLKNEGHVSVKGFSGLPGSWNEYYLPLILGAAQSIPLFGIGRRKVLVEVKFSAKLNYSDTEFVTFNFFADYFHNSNDLPNFTVDVDADGCIIDSAGRKLIANQQISSDFITWASRHGIADGRFEINAKLIV